MDGRDGENRNPSGLSPVENTGAVLPAQNPESQAIFTPPTTNETTDNLPTPLIAMNGQPLGNPNHNYFAHHPTRTFSSANGDIILGHGPKKAKIGKKPIIIGLIAIIITVVIFTAVYLIVGLMSKPSRADVAEAFAKYTDYIQNGPSGEGNSDSWFLLHLDELQYSAYDADEYTGEAYKLFNDFTKQLDASRLYKDNSALKDSINSERRMLNHLAIYYGINGILQPVIETYINDGQEAAMESIRQINSQYEQDGIDESFRDLVVEYLESNLALYKFYIDNACIFEDVLVNSCLATLDDNSEYNDTVDYSLLIYNQLSMVSIDYKVQLKTYSMNIQENLHEESK